MDNEDHDNLKRLSKQLSSDKKLNFVENDQEDKFLNNFFLKVKKIIEKFFSKKVSIFFLHEWKKSFREIDLIFKIFHKKNNWEVFIVIEDGKTLSNSDQLKIKDLIEITVHPVVDKMFKKSDLSKIENNLYISEFKSKDVLPFTSLKLKKMQKQRNNFNSDNTYNDNVEHYNTSYDEENNNSFNYHNIHKNVNYLPYVIFLKSSKNEEILKIASDIYDKSKRWALVKWEDFFKNENSKESFQENSFESLQNMDHVTLLISDFYKLSSKDKDLLFEFLLNPKSFLNSFVIIGCKYSPEKLFNMGEIGLFLCLKLQKMALNLDETYLQNNLNKIYKMISLSLPNENVYN